MVSVKVAVADGLAVIVEVGRKVAVSVAVELGVIVGLAVTVIV